MERNVTVRIQRNLVWIENWLCVLLAALLFWKGILPGWRVLHTDFPNYYLAARLLREGYSLDRIYDWVWLQRVKDHWGIDQTLVGFAGLTPFSALPIVPFSLLSALAAKRLWMLGNLFLLATTVEALHKVTTLGRRRVWLLCLLCVFPLRTSFLLGQMHLLVLALLVFAYALNRRQQHFACGACLSIAGMLKIYPFLFAAYFLWKKQWAALLALCSTAAVLLLVGTWAVGPGIFFTYVTEVLPRSLAGETLDPYNVQAGSMAAMMHRWFIYEPQLNPSPLWNSTLLYSALYPLWQVVVLAPLFLLLMPQERGREDSQLHCAAWIFGLLILSPVPASYHFVVMVLPVSLLADFLLKHRKWRALALTLGLYCLVSLVEFLPPRLAFSRLWVCIGFYIVLLYSLSEERPAIHRFSSRTALICASAFAFWAAGALHYQRHFFQLSQETERRLLPIPSAYLSTAPSATTKGLIYTAMQADKYAVIDRTGRHVVDETVDELSSAAARNSSGVIVETAGLGRSVLKTATTGGRAYTILQDAESPALSPDGMTVAFIRETKGRGTLWAAALQSPLGWPRETPIQLTDAAYDVHHLALAPSGRIVFSAKVFGQFSLFSLRLGNSPVELSPNATDIDFPAFSPDGQRIAFTRRIQDRWQLGYLDTRTGEEQMLTTGDCNAYSPQWMDAHRLVYASDCGRGLGLTALAAVVLEKPDARSDQ